MQDIVDFVSRTIQETGGGTVDKGRLTDAAATIVSEISQEVSAESASEAAMESAAEASSEIAAEAAMESAAEAGFGAPRFGTFR
ncbi:hypothetical protein GS597_13625 [Synechococcales cyanobacterium C]|uniref:Uncharacterized protein n=1 Tax=Petrachloros mirabilis ULC683 TaxID=2781853 RepID=A0A8K1ZYJ6_9CYAN|nr:hypothetical protein [Petrachloros mirabilis]NCJ07529.1 hypothetical protein [Petrachloros mirabilis ULC683]